MWFFSGLQYEKQKTDDRQKKQNDAQRNEQIPIMDDELHGLIKMSLNVYNVGFGANHALVGSAGANRLAVDCHIVGGDIQRFAVLQKASRSEPIKCRIFRSPIR